MNSPEEAGQYVTTLRALLRHIGTCDGNMQEGSLRADVNVSVRKKGDKNLGTRAEIKNINSIKFVKEAIVVEAKRQVALLESGQAMVQETRLYDPDRGETRPMRDKEDAADYRYFPDPDLLPLVLSDEFIAECRASLPMLPDEKKSLWQSSYGLSAATAALLLADKETMDYFESALQHVTDKTQGLPLANWIAGDLMANLNRHEVAMVDCPIAPQHLAELVAAVAAGTLSGKMAKDVFAAMWQERKSPKEIIAAKGLSQVSDRGAVELLVAQVMANHPDQVADYRAGNDKVFGFLVGQLMKLSQGRVNPQLANQLLKEKLK